MPSSRSPAPDSRAIVAANIWRMIEAETPPAAKPSVRAWALNRGLDVRLIDRLSKGKHAITLDKLEQVAAACGLKSWHLLIEDVDFKKPPDAPLSSEDRALLTKLRRILGD